VGTPTSTHPVSANPLSAASYQHPPGSAGLVPGEKKGKKRERDDGAGTDTGGAGNGSANSGAGSVNGNVNRNGGGMVKGNVGGVNGNMNTPTNVSANVPKSIVGAKAGVAGVRPRPLKKQRMVRSFLFLFYSAFSGCCHGMDLMEPILIFLS
jgi:hypothetical protein